MKKILLVLLSVFLLTGCNSNPIYKGYKTTSLGLSSKKVKTYQEITYNDFSKKISNNETFLVLLWQTGCSHCEDFDPKLKSIISYFNLEVYALNLADLSEDEYNKVKNKVFMSGTPTMAYIKDGTYEEKLSGDRSEEDVLEFLQKIKYLEEK